MHVRSPLRRVLLVAGVLHVLLVAACGQYDWDLPDLAGPAVGITGPSENDTVSGVVTVSAAAGDDSGIEAVQFLLDGTALGPAVSSLPYEVSWNTVLSSNGTHAVSALAWDALGNEGTALPVSVVVSNIVPMCEGTNLLANPGFENAPLLWSFAADAGTATASTLNPGYGGAFAERVRVNSNDSITEIQLYQFGLTLEPATRYRLTFAGYSVSGNDVRADVLLHSSPYTMLGLAAVVDLATSWQTHVVDFTTNASAGPDTRFRFWLGHNVSPPDDYWFDDVVLQRCTAIP